MTLFKYSFALLPLLCVGVMPLTAQDDGKIKEGSEKATKEDVAKADKEAKDAKKKKDEISHKVIMIDGSTLNGLMETGNIKIKTRFGTLSVPASDVVAIYPGLRNQTEFKKEISNLCQDLGTKDKAVQSKAMTKLTKKGGKILKLLQAELKKAEKVKNKRAMQRLHSLIEQIEIQMEEMTEEQRETYPYIEDDRLITKKFTIVGSIEQKSFKLKSSYGTLTIKFADLRKVVVKHSGEVEVIKKSIKISGSDNMYRYKDSGIRLVPGDKIKIVASGTISITSYGYTTGPEGNSNSMGMVNGVPSGALVAKVGKNDSFVTIGAGKTFVVKKAGKLSLCSMFNTRYTRYGVEGHYNVQIKVERGGGE